MKCYEDDYKKTYKVMLWKAYFEKGYSFASYPKWVLAIFGIGEVVNKNYMIVIMGALVFFLSCFFVGKWCYKYGFAAAEVEVKNKIDPFVNEVRDSKLFKG